MHTCVFNCMGRKLVSNQGSPLRQCIFFLYAWVLIIQLLSNTYLMTKHKWPYFHLDRLEKNYMRLWTPSSFLLLNIFTVVCSFHCLLLFLWRHLKCLYQACSHSSWLLKGVVLRVRAPSRTLVFITPLLLPLLPSHWTSGMESRFTQRARTATLHSRQFYSCSGNFLFSKCGLIC